MKSLMFSKNSTEERKILLEQRKKRIEKSKKILFYAVSRHCKNKKFTDTLSKKYMGCRDIVKL